MNEPADFLVLILDVNPISWALSAKQEHGLSLQNAVDNTVVLANAHLALRDENQIAIYAASKSKADLLFSSLVPLSTPDDDDVEDGSIYSHFRLVDRQIYGGVQELVQEPHFDTVHSGLVQALSKALSHVNRQATKDIKEALSPRILILSVTSDASQYIQMMNCIYSAQKLSIPIDICKIYGTDTVVLQQAAQLTSGAYLRLERPDGLLQYLMSSFLPGKNARRHFVIPTQDSVDLRAACFCHRKIVDLGYVCSVCLSIFCSQVEKCIVCKTPFAVEPQRHRRKSSQQVNGSNGDHQPTTNGHAAPIEID